MKIYEFGRLGFEFRLMDSHRIKPRELHRFTCICFHLMRRLFLNSRRKIFRLFAPFSYSQLIAKFRLNIIEAISSGFPKSKPCGSSLELRTWNFQFGSHFWKEELCKLLPRKFHYRSLYLPKVRIFNFCHSEVLKELSVRREGSPTAHTEVGKKVLTG